MFVQITSYNISPTIVGLEVTESYARVRIHVDRGCIKSKEKFVLLTREFRLKDMVGAL